MIKKKEKHESKIDHWLELLGEGRINQEKLLNKIAVAENELKIMVNVEGKLEVYFSVPCRDDGIHPHGGPNPGICSLLLYSNMAILSS